MSQELERLYAVHRFLNLQINKEAELQEIVELALELCDSQAAFITFKGNISGYFKIKPELDFGTHAPEDTFYRYFNGKRGMLVISDTLKDKEAINSPLVVNKPNIRFYAGVTLVTHDNLDLGTICVLDTKPRDLSEPQSHLLTVLAKRVVQFVEFDFSLDILRKQFLQAKDAEIKLRSFFESSVACHLLIGKEQEVLAYNKNMSHLLERLHNVKLHTGMNADQILNGAPLADFITDYKKALSGQTVQFEREVKYSNGEIIWWNVTYEPANDSSEEIIGVSYNATDITERKVQELQILEQNESLRQIAHIQSHELRKPTASILGIINLLRDDEYISAKEEFVMLQQAANELDDKIRSIVHFTD